MGVILVAFTTLALWFAGCSSNPASQLGDQPLTGVGPAVILTGDFPDPTVVRDGDTHYMTHSSFNRVPGLLIWRSKDLYNWQPLTHALRRHVGNVWAPDLIKHRGSLLPLLSGRRHELASDGLSVLGERRKVYDGWDYPSDWLTECFRLESPKLLQHDGFYYLTSAQGGTAGPATSHMVVSARSKSPLGPWENSPRNPIVRTWSRLEPWWSKGHGTVLEGPTTSGTSSTTATRTAIARWEGKP